MSQHESFIRLKVKFTEVKVITLLDLGINCISLQYPTHSGGKVTNPVPAIVVSIKFLFRQSIDILVSWEITNIHFPLSSRCHTSMFPSRNFVSHWLGIFVTHFESSSLSQVGLAVLECIVNILQM